MDVIMPEMDGFETCRQLKKNEQTRDIPVIFMTGLSDPQDKVEGFQAGGADYITKPFHRIEVIARIRHHLQMRKLQQSYREQHQELLKMNMVKSHMIELMNHELKSPFVGMSSAISVIRHLLDDVEKYQMHDILDMMETTVEQGGELLDNLLAWFAIQCGNATIRPEAVDLYDLVVSNLCFVSDAARAKHIDLVNQIEPETHIFADEKMISAVMKNLLKSAVQYTLPNSCITLSALQENGHVEVKVHDTGIRLSNEDLQHLFQIEATTLESRTAADESRGLSLILSKEYIERNGGSIQVESTPGESTTFCFTVPYPREELQEMPVLVD